MSFGFDQQVVPSKTLARTIASLEKSGFYDRDPTVEPLCRVFASSYDSLKTGIWAALTGVQEGRILKEDAYQSVCQQMKGLIHSLVSIFQTKEGKISELSTQLTNCEERENAREAEEERKQREEEGAAIHEATRLKERVAQLIQDFNEERIAWKNELNSLILNWRTVYSDLEQHLLDLRD